MIKYILYSYILSDEVFSMINGARTPKLIIQTAALPFYSSALKKAKVSPIIRVGISGFDRSKAFDLKISISGKCKSIEFLHRCDFVKHSFHPEMYNFKQSNLCVFDFSFDCFELDGEFLCSLTEDCDADIYIMVTCGKELATASVPIKLLANRVWQGLDYFPEMICDFANKYDENIAEVCKNISEKDYADYSKNPLLLSESLKSVYSALKEKNIIYTRPVGYSAGAAQKIKSAKELFGGSSALATPLELALAFCACAEKCGFDAALLFVRGKTGEINVYNGLWMKKSPADRCICEDIDFICSCIEYGELIVVEPGVFAAAQNTSFSLAVSQACRNVLSAPANIVCLADFCHAPSRKSGENTSVKNNGLKKELSEAYAVLSESPAVKMLGGLEYGRFPEIPLLVTDFDSFLVGNNVKFRLYPLDVNIRLSDYAGVDGDFSSVITETKNSSAKFSAGGSEELSEKLGRLKEKLTKPEGIVCALKEEKMCETASHITFGKSRSTAFVTLGYVRICDKLTQEVNFVPMSLVPAEMSLENGVYYVKTQMPPIVNKVFVRNALNNAGISSESFMKADMPVSKKDIFEMFSEIISKLCETSDRYSYRLVKEAHIIYLDLSDYYLWNDLSVLKERIISSKAINQVFEGGNENDKVKDREKNSGKENSTVTISTLFADKESMNAAACQDSKLVFGAFEREKLLVLSAYVKKAITEGKTVLVTAKNRQVAKSAAEFLRHDGLENGVFLADCVTDAANVSGILSDLLEKYTCEEETNVSDIPKELKDTQDEINSFENTLKETKIMGVTLPETLYAYLDASLPSDAPELYVDETVFENTLDKLFSDAGRLISEARRLCLASGLPEYAPINTHPLYGTKPEKRFSEADEGRVRTLSANILPVISEFRDTFIDVSEIVNLELNHIKTLDALSALNDLYRLALSARDVDVPEIFRESDIEHFSNTAKTVNSLSERCEAIRFKLPFFQPELFDDIETVLTGDKYEEEEKGFLKKFLHRRNDEEKLLQYVDAENIAAFKAKSLEEIYALLYEYKTDVKLLKRCETRTGGFSKELAELAAAAGELLDRITPDNRNTVLSGFFKLVSVIPTDYELARSITVSRAQFAELFSDGELSLSELGAYLGVEFSKMSFENGILAFDGISSFISGAVNSLDVTQYWLDWLKTSYEVSEKLPSFAEYITTHGACGNVDRLFARSLLLPAAKYIRQSLFDDERLTKISVAKEKYIPLALRACEISKRNCNTAYTQSVLHLSKTNRKDSLGVKGNISVKEYIRKHRPLVSKLIPCIVTSADILTRTIPEDMTFDISCVLDDKDSFYKMLPALSFGKQFAVFNMSPTERSELFERLSCSDIKKFETGKISTEKNAALFSYINSKCFDGRFVLAKPLENSEIELVRVNGSYDKVSRVNKSEAELAVSKACELLAAYREPVAVCAFTEQTAQYCHRFAYMQKKKNRLLEKALDNDMIRFCTPEKLYFSGCTTVVVCASVCSDRLYGVSHDYALAETHSSSYSLPDAYIQLCGMSFKKMYFITCVSNAEEKYSKHASGSYYSFLGFSDFLDGQKIPVCFNNVKKPLSLVPVLLGAVGSDARFFECSGKDNCGAQLFSSDGQNRLYIYSDFDSGVSMHDMLVCRYYAQNSSEVMTVSQTSFADQNIKLLLKDLGRREQ